MKFIEYIRGLFKKTQNHSHTHQQMLGIINIIDNDTTNDREFTKYANLYLIGEGVYISMDTARVVYCSNPNIVKEMTFCDVFESKEELQIVKAFKNRTKRFNPDFSKVVIK